MYIIAILVVVASVYLGITLGISDCKRTFGIPKGIKTPEEFISYLSTSGADE